MKNIIFVPGLTSPFHESHKSAYESLIKESEQRGYLSKMVCLPGQINEQGDIQGILSPESSIEALTKILVELEQTQEKYRLVGFSSGCAVVISTIYKLQVLTGLEAVVLWGTVPFWHVWRVFVLGKDRDGLGKGTNIIQPEEKFFNQLEPLEFLLPLIDYPTTIALGKDDPYISVSYIDYLKSITSENNKKNFIFKIIEGCKHTVKPSENWQGYLSTIF
ncbi:MAG: hypothetical protein SGJ02_10485 [bacterium]|nr:hypothetical protein [bacterium]